MRCGDDMCVAMMQCCDVSSSTLRKNKSKNVNNNCVNIVGGLKSNITSFYAGLYE